MGRPPKPAGEKLGERVVVNMTKAERKRIGAEARKRGMSLSALLMFPWRRTE